jgi:hypothetical protein
MSPACLWSQAPTVRTIHVWIDTDDWSEAKLLKQLNFDGKGKHCEFEARRAL